MRSHTPLRVAGRASSGRRPGGGAARPGLRAVVPAGDGVRRRRGRFRFRVAAVAAVFAVAAATIWWGGSPVPRGGGLVTRVVDGDTLDVAAPGRPPERVRVLGVDTPEVHGPGSPECFGPEAAAFTARVGKGALVELRYDRERRDRYGRTLAAVVLRSGPLAGRPLADELVRRGYARVLVIPPNVAAARRLRALQAAARAEASGLWGACR